MENMIAPEDNRFLQILDMVKSINDKMLTMNDKIDFNKMSMEGQINKLIQENKLDVTDEDLRMHMKEEVMRYFGQMNMGEDMSWLDSYIDRMMKDEKQIDATYRRLITERLFSFMEGQVKTESKKVTPDELNAMQHNHQH